MQMIALGVLLAGPAGREDRAGHQTWTGLVMLWMAALLTLWTGYDYLKAGDRARPWSAERHGANAHALEDPLFRLGAREDRQGRGDRRAARRRRHRRRSGRLAEAASGREYAEAFARSEVIRAAIDQHARQARRRALAGAREIAFFPPVTGG